MGRKTGSLISFSKAAIDALEVPKKSRVYHYDERMPGLAICVTPAGSKTFYLARRVGRKFERVKIGSYPKTTPEQARVAAAKLNGDIAHGTNVAERRRTELGAETLKQAYDEFVLLPARSRSKRPRSEVTKKNYKYLFENYLEDWGSRRTTEITRHDVEKLHNKLAKSSGPYLANRVLALVRAIFNSSFDRGGVVANPAARISLFFEEPRARFLQADELPRFWKALEAEPNEKLRDFFKLCLFTGQRRTNVLSMRWDDVLPLSRGTWEIPETKTGRHQVPLTKEALAILKRRLTSRTGPFVLPGRHTSHLNVPDKYWEDLLKRAGITNLRIHDLRRSMGSWQAKTGASLTIVGKTLGHARPETTAIYARVDDAPVRQSMEAATAAIMAAAKKKRKPR